MKRNLTILGVCALVALGTILVFSSKRGGGRTAATTQSLVITQDGKLVVQSQPNWKVTVVMDQSKTNTNTSSPATKPGNK
jgi:hypothetical protein